MIRFSKTNIFAISFFPYLNFPQIHKFPQFDNLKTIVIFFRFFKRQIYIYIYLSNAQNKRRDVILKCRVDRLRGTDRSKLELSFIPSAETLFVSIRKLLSTDHISISSREAKRGAFCIRLSAPVMT